MKARRQRKARFFGDDGQINQDLSKQTLLHLSPFYVEPFSLMLGVQTKRGKPFDFPLFHWGAVGETRTRTGLLPLPPQSSVSTISPPPLCFGIAKVRQKIKSPNFFEKIFTFLSFFCKKGQNSMISGPKLAILWQKSSFSPLKFLVFR